MKKILYIIPFLILLLIQILLLGCSTEPRYTAEEWEELQSSKIEDNTPPIEEPKSNNEIDIYNNNLLEFSEFMAYYNDIKKEYEDVFSDSSKESVNNMEATKILDLTAEEMYIVENIRVFPQFLKRYIEYDLEYIENRGIFYGTLLLLTENGKRELTENDYPNYTNELNDMLDSSEKKNNEFRKIIIDFNNRAKELGLNIPFPNQ